MHLPKPAPKTVYIGKGVCNTIRPEWPIDWYELESRATLSNRNHVAIRIKSPANLMVYKTTLLDIDGTIITHHFKSADNRSLNSLDWEPVVRINEKWVMRYDLKSCKSFGEYDRIMLAEGYTPVPGLGYLTPKQYQKWVNKGLKN